MGRLEGKVAIVTGGARGQGGAESALFAREGAQVVVADVLDDDGRKTAAAAGGIFFHLDVSNEEAWGKMVAEVMDRFGHIDVLVNNAGIFRPGRLTDTSLADYMHMIDINQVGVFLGMKAVAGPMINAGRGSIVNISSIAGMQASANGFAYGASKWAVRGMTKTAARELGRFGIRVNSIHPGLIDTPMLHELPGVDADGGARMLRGVPIRRVAQPEEVANLALYLASDESSYSTGSEFIVDGGATA
ncbi:MAG: glucose 1-dehydrogenase [Chloroflexi bacterium]|nr:glucose 1-dehydrogenase [Chloroflexota bacterium]